ncbi:MAG: leucine-rich repeat protein [Bacteroidaceae bacterium]|nr:leucine-rich repeat protein [Bacteroidaceae bacterium]
MNKLLTLLLLVAPFISGYASPSYESSDADKQEALETLRTVIATVDSFIVYEAGFQGGEKLELQTNYANKTNFLWCNEAERDEGPIINLIDGNPATYFHSCWTSTIEPVHWIQVNLDTAIERFDFNYHTRQDADANFPQAIEVMGSNDGATFTTIKTFNENLPQEPDKRWESGVVAASQPYNYLRFVVTAPSIFFHMAEFAIYTETIISDKYRPHLGYLNNLRDVKKEADAIYSNSENVAAEDIIVIAEKLKAYYALKDNVIKGEIADYGIIDNLVWKLENNEITISGKGDIPELDNSSDYPWYKHKNSICSVVLDDNITGIYDYAFYNYDNLVKITFGKNVQTVGEYAFWHSSKLKVTFKSTVPPNLENYCFDFSKTCITYIPDGCGEAYQATGWGLFYVEGEGITINATLTEAGTLGDNILAQIENFKDVNNLVITGPINSDDIYIIQNSLTGLVSLDMAGVPVTSLNDYMFEGRHRLQKIVLPSTLKSISNYMFRYCYMLDEIVLPQSVTTIGYYAFYDCYSLRNIDIHEGVTSLGYDAFEYCKTLKSVKLPSTLTTIQGSTFRNCEQLKKVQFSEGLNKINSYAFSNCALDTLVLPSTIQYLGSSAFGGNDFLKRVELNEGLYEMDGPVFSGCDALTEITLPSSLVLADGSSALFHNCTNLKKVTCLSVEPPYIEAAVKSNLDGCELYVPSISLNVYKQTQYWDAFPTIKPIDYLPQNITILGNHRLALPDNLPVDYNPNVNLLVGYNGNSWSCGALKITGDKEFNASSFNTVWDNYNDRYCSLVNGSIMRADNSIIDMNVRTNKWIFFTLPFDVKVSEIEPTSDGTTNFIIRRYDGQLRADGQLDATWVKMAADDILKAGEGYILQASRYVGTTSQSESNFRFKAMDNANKNKIFANGDETVILNEYSSEFMHNRSWNLIGNPYPCYYDTRYIDFSSPITVWNASDQTYSAYSLTDDSYILLPGQAFFVQCPVGNKKMVFDEEGRQTDKVVRTIESADYAETSGTPVKRTVINLTISDGANKDRTRVVINNKAAMQYEIEKDASKFMSNNVAVPQIYTVNDGVNYSINERPLGNGKVELNTIINSDGTYTIALAGIPQECTVCLLDKKTGAKVSLNETEYSFNACAGEDVERFSLLIDGLGTTGIDAIDTDSSDDGDIYSIHGIKVEKPTQKGIYIQKGKKIIVK